jgi:cysteinyl-tRNA synthetase
MKQVEDIKAKCYEAMNDDMASPLVISQLFEACRLINSVLDKHASITAEVAAALKDVFGTFAFDILGLKADSSEGSKEREAAYGAVVDMLLEQRQQAKVEKNWALSDAIRDRLSELGFEVKDTKDGFTWTLNK